MQANNVWPDSFKSVSPKGVLGESILSSGKSILSSAVNSSVIVAVRFSRFWTTTSSNDHLTVYLAHPQNITGMISGIS